MAPLRLRLISTRVLSVALLFALCTCLVAGCGDADSPLPTAVATPVQSTVTRMANLPLSTVTSVPTKIRAWTAAEQAYIDKVGLWGNRYADDLSKMTDLLASPNPLDSGWSSEVNNTITDFDALNNEVLNYTAPARFSGIQERLTKAAGHCETGANLVAAGTSEFDLGKLQQGAGEIEVGAAMVPLAIDDLAQLAP